MSLLNQYTYALLSTAISLFLLSIFVYFQNPTRKVNKVFALYCLTIIVWSFGQAMHINAKDEHLAIFWARFFHGGVIFIAVTLLQFLFTLLEIEGKKKKIVSFVYGLGLIFLVISFTNLFIPGVTPKFSFNFYWKIGPLYYPFLIFWFGTVIYAHYETFKVYTKSSGIRRNQLKYFFWASIFGYLGGTPNYLPAFDIEIPIVNPFGTYAVPIYSCVIAYAITRYRLMDINIVLKKGLAYTLLLALTLIPTYFFVVLIERYFKGTVNYPFGVILLGLFVIAALVFYKMKIKMDQVVEQTFFKERYNAYETLRDFTKAMVSILNLKELGNRIVDTLVNTMGVEKASVFLYDEDRKHFYILSSYGFKKDKGEKIRLTWKDDLMPWLKDQPGVIIREELQIRLSGEKIQKIVNQMEEIESEVCIPFIVKNKLIGFCNLGRKINKGMFSTEDLNLLTTLAQQAAIALENARLYEEQKKAKILMRRADRLASLGTLAAGLAHEIRNPLTSIATFAELLPERKDDEEFMSSFCGIARSEAERIKILLTELLDYARPSAPKLEESDINEVVESMVLFIGKEAEKKEVRILAEFAEGLPKIMIDKHQIKQVFLNLLMNAIEAISSGGEITVTTRSPAPKGNMDFVQVEIRDTGVGIPEESLDRIFDPFFTTKHDSDTHVGTGLGLAIVHQIVQEHRGSIDVESKTGKGTTFYVNLPINPLLYERRRKKEEGEEG